MQVQRSHSQSRGLTLIEVCATLAVIAIMVGSAVPSIDGVLKSKRFEGQASELAIDLRYVRSEAVARNEGVRIRFQNVMGGTCAVIHTGSATDCSCGANGAAQCNNGATTLKTMFYPAGGVAIQSNVASMRFDPSNGTVTPAATIRVVNADGRAVHHVVNMVGRVRSCAAGGAVPGLKAC